MSGSRIKNAVRMVEWPLEATMRLLLSIALCFGLTLPANADVKPKLGYYLLDRQVALCFNQLSARSLRQLNSGVRAPVPSSPLSKRLTGRRWPMIPLGKSFQASISIA